MTSYYVYIKYIIDKIELYNKTPKIYTIILLKEIGISFRNLLNVYYFFILFYLGGVVICY
jgi:hypothetical protein